MKYYETTNDEYLNKVNEINLHPEIQTLLDKINTEKYINILFYGASGTGKYSQVLYLLKKYSNTNLKYFKKITTSTDKQNYTYNISDIHYEIDMGLLGCHSKILWHEIFYQIVDIISIKTNKIGFIVCYNFHLIHNELLEIFYSYVQQYSNINSLIKINFIIITENISFLPNSILNSFQIINVKRPSSYDYNNIIIKNTVNSIKIEELNNENLNNFKKQINNITQINKDNFNKNFSKIDTCDIINIKELKSFSKISKNLPEDIFNIINDNIIDEMKNVDFQKLRDNIYDIFIYNLDGVECIWYIIAYFVNNNFISKNDISDILYKCNNSLLYFNNNYRPIYHLERFLYNLCKIIHEF